MQTMVEHESFDGDRYDDMPQTVDELPTAAAEDEVEAVTMHELGRCHWSSKARASIAPRQSRS